MGHLRERPVRRQQVFEEAACRRPLIPDDYMLLNKTMGGQKAIAETEQPRPDGAPVVYVSPELDKSVRSRTTRAFPR